MSIDISGKIASVILLVLLLSTCTSRPEVQDKALIIGAKIYDHEGDLNDLFDAFKDAGLNSIFASTDLLSDPDFRKNAETYDIKTFAILPIFFAPEELEADTTLYAITQWGTFARKEWVQFACPSNDEFRSSKISFIKDFVDTYKPDGISIDFIRHFAYWEKVYVSTELDSLPNTCFDDRCISRFCEDNDLKLPDGDLSEFEIYEWIKNHHFETWVTWKSGLITEMVRSIVEAVKPDHPELLINLHAVPWRQSDFQGAITKITGQDFKAISPLVDYISPMTYSHMVKREPEWISSVVQDIHEVSGSDILPSIQVGIAYLSDTLSVGEFKDCLESSLLSPSKGVIFWNWDALYAEKGKLEAVRARFAKNQ